MRTSNSKLCQLFYDPIWITVFSLIEWKLIHNDHFELMKCAFEKNVSRLDTIVLQEIHKFLFF